MQGRDASSGRDNWDKPAKGENPDRKPYVLQGTGVEHRASNLVLEKLTL